LCERLGVFRPDAIRCCGLQCEVEDVSGGEIARDELANGPESLIREPLVGQKTGIGLDQGVLDRRTRLTRLRKVVYVLSYALDVIGSASATYI
jgi:hypothetical protein